MAAIWQRVLGVSLSPAGASLVILIVQPVSMPLQRASSSDVPIEHAGAIVDSLRVGGDNTKRGCHHHGDIPVYNSGCCRQQHPHDGVYVAAPTLLPR